MEKSNLNNSKKREMNKMKIIKKIYETLDKSLPKIYVYIHKAYGINQPDVFSVGMTNFRIIINERPKRQQM